MNRKEEFKKWLEQNIKKNAASDCASRCNRVEKTLNVNLDKEYNKDCGESLLNKLSIRNKNEKTIADLSKKFGFTSEKATRTGVSDLKSAVKRYMKFLSEN